MKYVALIPARSGSKRIKDKNIRQFNNKPLIVHSILTALASKYITEIYVSTDSPRIKQVAISSGAICSSLRPSEISTDSTSMYEVVDHFINSTFALSVISDLCIILLQPTSPLRQPYDVDQCIETLQNKRCSSVVSLSKLKHISHPSKLYTLDPSGQLNPQQFTNPGLSSCTQYYHRNGPAVLAFTAKAMLDSKSLYPTPSYGYLMNPLRSIDIDTEEDWSLAEMIHRSFS